MPNRNQLCLGCAEPKLFYLKLVGCKRGPVNYLVFLHYFIACCYFRLSSSPSSIFPWTMRLTSHAAKMCCRVLNKRLLLVGTDSFSDELFKSFHREFMKSSPAAPGLTILKLCSIAMPCWATANCGDHDEANVDVNPRYAEVGYRANAV